MKLYLVRHGQSLGNLNKIHQSADTPLSDQGLAQAQELAKRFETIPVNIILSSHFERAKTTAEIVAHHIGSKIEIVEELREVKRPSELEGKSTTDEYAISIKMTLLNNMHISDWHFSDEENLYELFDRARKFIAIASKRNEESIVAVSHGNFILAVVGVLLFDTLLTPQLYRSMETSMYLNNTGITVLERVVDKWRVITWNDNAHLGNL